MSIFMILMFGLMGIILIIVVFSSILGSDRAAGESILYRIFPILLMVVCLGCFIINPSILSRFVESFVGLLKPPDEADSSKSGTPSAEPRPTETPTPSSTPTEEPIPAPNQNWAWSDFLLVAAAIVGSLIVIIAVWGIAQWLIGRWKERAPQREEARLKMEQTRAHREENKEIWTKVLAEGDALVEKWISLSSDVSTVVKNPIYGRLDNPLTQQVVQAISAVRNERRETLADWDTDPWTTVYAKAVKQLRDDLKVLESSAKFYHLNNFSERELKLLSQAENILSMARNEAASPNERQMAYARLKVIFADLHLDLSPEAEDKLSIEQREVKMLTAG